jgi:hypothetical protein
VLAINESARHLEKSATIFSRAQAYIACALLKCGFDGGKEGHGCCVHGSLVGKSLRAFPAIDPPGALKKWPFGIYARRYSSCYASYTSVSHGAGRGPLSMTELPRAIAQPRLYKEV